MSNIPPTITSLTQHKATKSQLLIQQEDWDGVVQIGSEAIQPLINCLLDKDESVEKRESIIKLLSSLKEIAVEPVINALDNPVPDSRGALISALFSFDDPKCTDVLISCLSDESAEIREYVVDQLTCRNIRISARPIKALYQDPDVDVQKTAREAIQHFSRGTVNHYQQVEGNYSRTIVCGDIHGCYDEMMVLLDNVNFSEDDIFVCVGDMLDRGPKSWEVAEFFRNAPNAYCVLGNHERRVANVVRGISDAAWSQEQTLSLIPHDSWGDWAEWLESLPAVIETNHAIVTHAQLDPEFNLHGQSSYVTAGIGGAGLQIQLDNDGVPIWFHKTRFNKPICIGHKQYDRPELVPKRLFALDDSCCFEGKLTAAIFPSGEVISISAKADYFNISKREWFKQKEQRLLQQDSATFSIDFAILTLKENGESTPHGEAMKLKLSDYIIGLAIDDRASRVRVKLFDHFGPMPDPGIDRGGYFIKIKRSFHESLCSALASAIIGKNISAIEHLQPILRKGVLGDIEIVFNQLEKELIEINSSYDENNL